MAKYVIENGKEIRIAISGKSGCGNTTVCTILSQMLGITLINYTFRQLAKEKGMTLKEVIEAAKTDDSYDKYVDFHQVELAMKSSCVLGSRLSIWMLKNADIKVYLFADNDVRVKRICEREGGKIEDVASFTAMRDKEDNLRYKALYGIDNDDYKGTADIVIDTNRYDAKGVAKCIIDEMLKRRLIRLESTI